MKARRLLGVLACGLAALLLPAAAAAGLPKGAISLSTIKLGESNGYEVELVTGSIGKQRPRVAVSVEADTASAGYSVRTEDRPGIHATFGSLGQVGLGFHRQKKVVERPERNCRWIIEVGVFRGKLSFVGEGGYVSVDATSPKGEIFRLPDGFCGLGSFRPGFLPPGLPRETVLATRMKTGAREVSFRASRELSKRATIQFNAETLERVEGMRIDRNVRISGKKGEFTATGTSRAAVSPPPPFSGYATFRDPEPGPIAWEGPLAVNLPGLETLPLTGEGFTARLCPSLSILEGCLPRRRGLQLRPYGSGSHSQPLALARLSSLR